MRKEKKTWAFMDIILPKYMKSVKM